MNVLLLSRNQPMGHYRNNDVIVPLKCLGGFTSYATNGTLQRSWRHYPCYLCSPITTQQQLTATGSGSSFFLSERDAHHFLEINKIIFTVQWLLSERGHDHVARPELLCWSSKRQQKILKLSEKTAVILYDNRSTMFPMVFYNGTDICCPFSHRTWWGDISFVKSAADWNINFTVKRGLSVSCFQDNWSSPHGWCSLLFCVRLLEQNVSHVCIYLHLYKICHLLDFGDWISSIFAQRVILAGLCHYPQYWLKHGAFRLCSFPAVVKPLKCFLDYLFGARHRLYSNHNMLIDLEGV